MSRGKGQASRTRTRPTSSAVKVAAAVRRAALSARDAQGRALQSRTAYRLPSRGHTLVCAGRSASHTTPTRSERTLSMSTSFLNLGPAESVSAAGPIDGWAQTDPLKRSPRAGVNRPGRGIGGQSDAPQSYPSRVPPPASWEVIPSADARPEQRKGGAMAPKGVKARQREAVRSSFALGLLALDARHRAQGFGPLIDRRKRPYRGLLRAGATTAQEEASRRCPHAWPDAKEERHGDHDED